jgi:hypothetical protein
MEELKKDSDVESDSPTDAKDDVFGNEEGHQVCSCILGNNLQIPVRGTLPMMMTIARFTTKHCHGK